MVAQFHENLTWAGEDEEQFRSLTSKMSAASLPVELVCGGTRANEWGLSAASDLFGKL